MPRRLPAAGLEVRGVSGLAILVLIVGAGVFILDRIAEDDAIDNAREITRWPRTAPSSRTSPTPC